MKIIICLFLFLCSACIVQAQQENVDSLINLLKNDKLTVDEELELYHKITNAYFLQDYKKTIYYIKKGLDLAEMDKKKAMISKFSAAYGRFHTVKSNYDTAFIHYEKALDYALQVKDKNLEKTVYLHLGNLYSKQEEYTFSLEYFMKALSIYEEIGDKEGSVITLSNIAAIYRRMLNDERVFYYLEKAKKIADEIGFDGGRMQIYFELGAIYHSLAKKEVDKVELALEYMLKANELSNKLGHKAYQAATTQGLAVIYTDYLKDGDKALKYANESFQLAQEIGERHALAFALSSISSAYFLQKRYQESEETAMEAWEVDSTEYYMGTDILKNIILSNIALGNKNKAERYLKKYNDFSKIQVDNKSREIMADMDVKYETEKKEIRITALEKEKQLYLWLGIAGVSILLLAFGLLFYRHRLTIQKRKMAEQQRELAEQQVIQLEQEKQLIATQSVLDGETAERSRLARDLHDGLGGLLSVVKLNLKSTKGYAIMDGDDVDHFVKATEILDQSISELRRVAHHLMPESLMRYGLKVSLEDFCRAIPGVNFQYLGNGSRLENRMEVLIYRCTYELVNNAVKHAEAKSVNVQLLIDEGLVSLTVQDNGIGFDPKKTVAGTGLDNIRTRVSAYNGKMTIYSQPGNGTEISIEIEKMELNN